MKITLTQALAPKQPEGQWTAYVTHIEGLQEGLQKQRELHIPLSTFKQNGQLCYRAALGGHYLQATNPSELAGLIRRWLASVIHFGRLPDYVFIARKIGLMYPVYTVGSEVCAVVSNSGPVFRHVELAKVREYLRDYLRSLPNFQTGDPLHIRGIHQRTLALKRPALYFRKRIFRQTEFWAPVFENTAGDALYAYAVNARREAPKTNGLEILQLHQQVSQALQNDHRLEQACDLRLERLQAAYWFRLKAKLTSLPEEIIVAGQALSAYQSPLTPSRFLVVEACQETPAAATPTEAPSDAVRYNLFLGDSLEDAHRRVIQDFIRRKMITTAPPSS